MKKGTIIGITLILVLSFGLYYNHYSRKANKTAEDAPVFVQYFDWFNEASWKEEEFVDPLDWSSIGVNGKDRNSEDFYFKQFTYIKSLGIDALAWEYNPRRGLPPSYPSESAIKALKRSGLKIAPFYDLEIAFKVKFQETGNFEATLSNPEAIKPNKETVDFMTSQLQQFFDHVPNELLAHDKKDRQVVYIFGYGFDDKNPNPDAWTRFADGLTKNVAKMAGAEPAFYWTTKNSVFQEHLFLHHRENFVPFHFVLDTPQSQYGHESVTWNFGFDNLGVQKRDGLQRVIRNDPRYVEEMGWLANATNPSAIFIYSWNEPFEDSMLLPTKHWGDTKAKLAKSFIERLRQGKDDKLPKTLLITDNLDEYWTNRKDDWHILIEREMLLYTMRRFAPQADVKMASEVKPEILDQYSHIIDISTSNIGNLSDYLYSKINTHKIMVFDPKKEKTKLGETFAKYGESPTINADVKFNKGAPLFVRDDINKATPCEGCQVIAKIDLPNSKDVPLVVHRDDDVWVNAYNTDERVFKYAFESFYQTPMNISIMYGEGLSSQRLEVDPKTKEVNYNRLNRYSINGHWDIPSELNWFRMPPEIDEKHKDFIFGQDN